MYLKIKFRFFSETMRPQIKGIAFSILNIEIEKLIEIEFVSFLSLKKLSKNKRYSPILHCRKINIIGLATK